MISFDLNELETNEYLEQKEYLKKELELGLNSEMVENFDRNEFLESLHEKYMTD